MQNIPSVSTLQEALGIRREIESLENRLTNIFSGGGTQRPSIHRAAPAPARRPKQPPPAPSSGAKKKKGMLSPEGRAKLSAQMKARWAARKRSGKMAL